MCAEMPFAHIERILPLASDCGDHIGRTAENRTMCCTAANDAMYQQETFRPNSVGQRLSIDRSRWVIGVPCPQWRAGSDRVEPDNGSVLCRRGIIAVVARSCRTIEQRQQETSR
jgi:hypothetical protein